MLTALLPGFRDIRSALVAGYMWIVGAWLIVGYFWPDFISQAGVVADPLKAVLAVLGSAGSLVALSLLCLIVGEFTSGIIQGIFRQLSVAYVYRITPENFTDLPRGPLDIFRPMSRRAMNRVYLTTRRQFDRTDVEATAPSVRPDETPMSADQAGVSALREVLFLSPRLIVAKPELYVEHDRVKSESAFRDAILFPMPIVTVGILLNLHIALALKIIAVLFILAIDAYLFLQARQQFREAYSMVAHSLADGTISSAAVGDR